MSTLLAFVIGGLYAAGIYTLLRPNLFKLLIGLMLLGHAGNLLIFTAAGLVRGAAPIVPEGARMPVEAIADPLPQALILTAIVINFGTVAFTLALAYRTYRSLGTEDTDVMRATER